MIKAIVFDFFDVIRTDPYKQWLKSHGYERTGAFLDASQRLDSGQINLDEFLSIISKLSGDSVSSIMNVFESGAKINNSVVTIINKLHGPYMTALLSNAPSDLIRPILEENDLERLFDEIIISSEVGLIKPNRAIFELIAKKLKVDPSEILFVDDIKLYVEGAEKAGIKSIQFINAEQLTKDIKKLNLAGYLSQ